MHRTMHQAAIQRASVVASFEEARLRRAAEQRQERAQAAHSAAADAFIAAVMSEALVRVERMGGIAREPAAEFLAEPGHDAAQVLAAACRHAMFGDDQAAAELLRKFVDAVACEYASQNLDLFL